MSRRTSRLQNLRAKKDRRMKIVAIGGAVVLVALLAWELPHFLGGSSSPSAAATTSASVTPGSATTGATTTPGATASGTAVSATAHTKLPNSDAVPTRTKSQLYSFDMFAGKDPFVQQVSAQTATAGLTSGGGATSGPPAAGLGGGGGAAQTTSARTLATSGVATIQVNGKNEVVRIGASFPSANPVFRLVSLASGVANIGIANGSYTSGAQTIRLSRGQLLTLVDTADGIRYKLRLASAS